jgi:Rod binding domain-containing protein
MNTTVSAISAQNALQSPPLRAKTPSSSAAADPSLRKAFDSFVGEAFFAQTLKSMRKTLGKPAYFHGGRAEEAFQQQLDQVLAEKLSSASGDKLSGPMFELFTLPRK